MRESLTTIEKALVMKELEYFHDVPVEQLAEIAGVATEMHFEAGDVLVEPSDPADHAYAVVEGDLVVERDGVVTTVISAGRGFGDLSFKPAATFQLRIRALTETLVLRIAVSDLLEAMLEQPEIAVGLVRGLSVRVSELSQQVATLSRHLQDGTTPPAPRPPESAA
jgi:CRP-like cAMP-binding protein